MIQFVPQSLDNTSWLQQTQYGGMNSEVWHCVLNRQTCKVFGRTPALNESGVVGGVERILGGTLTSYGPMYLFWMCQQEFVSNMFAIYWCIRRSATRFARLTMPSMCWFQPAFHRQLYVALIYIAYWILKPRGVLATTKHWYWRISYPLNLYYNHDFVLGFSVVLGCSKVVLSGFSWSWLRTCLSNSRYVWIYSVHIYTYMGICIYIYVHTALNLFGMFCLPSLCSYLWGIKT